MPIEARRAKVAPRIHSPDSDETILLTDYVQQQLTEGTPIVLRLRGEGKTIALEHLAAALSDWPSVEETLELEDEKVTIAVENPIVTVRTNPESTVDVELNLAKWTRDDFIEYLLNAHSDECSSVMLRLQNADLQLANGSPEVWRMILDRMAADSAKSDIEQIVLDELANRIPQNQIAAIADQLLVAKKHGEVRYDLLSQQHASVKRILSHTEIRHLFLNWRVSERIETDSLSDLLSLSFMPHFLLSVADRLKQSESAIERLETFYALAKGQAVANCATLLCRAHPNWRPRGKRLELLGAVLDEANWPDISLSEADLRQTSFRDANLSGAKLDSARIGGADLSGANLSDADLSGIGVKTKKNRLFSRKNSNTQQLPAAESETSQAKRSKGKGKNLSRADKKRAKSSKRRYVNEPTRASFSGAQMCGTNLSGCIFLSADFSEATMQRAQAVEASFYECDFKNADLSDADFSQTHFDRSSLQDVVFDRCDFHSSRFKGVDFEDVVASAVDFSFVDFQRALLTGSQFPKSSFSCANLTNCRLAEVHWEYCDLRKADLRGVNFHLGSTRSGLVDSPYPSHGTRTGFYTDEYEEQYFKAPEVIRKANLFGADLRGANIAGVDFYLVDLREAKFDRDQREHLVSTGAILSDGPFGD